MTHFSYNDSDLSTGLNQVRLIIQDTSSTGALFSDEEIQFFIDTESNVFGAVSLAAYTAKAKFAQSVSKTVGKLSIELQQKAEHYGALGDKYALLAQTKGTVQLFAGGLSITGKEAELANSDRVDPKFTRDQDQFPGTGEDFISTEST